MVHALERARKHLRGDGVLVLLQPHQFKRPLIAVATPRMRQPVGALQNSVFQPLINAANAAIDAVIEDGRFALIGRSNHRFSVRLASPSALRRYLHLGQRPPRFPAGTKQRLQDLWSRRSAGTQIEVTEYLTVIGLLAR